MRSNARRASLRACALNRARARAQGVPITVGLLRFNPDDTVDLARHEGQWERATDEVLAALDTEVRLGVKRTLVHEAAELLLLWKRGPIRPNDDDDER